MALLTKIDSNVTGLRIAEEASLGVLPAEADQIWIPYEPNSYADFGGEITTIARNPINPSRQRKKGVVTDLDASGGFNTDLTQSNLQDILQGFFFASLRTKSEFISSDVAGGPTNEYEVATFDATEYLINDLLFAKDFTDLANNGLKTVDANGAGILVGVVETLVTETPPADATISKVGFQFVAGDAKIVAPGSPVFPTLTTEVAGKDMTEFGLIPGEWVFIGGDVTGASGDQFQTAVNNGFARVRSVTANVMTFDKTSAAMVSEGAAGTDLLTIKIFFGRVLKNELGPDITRRTYQLERILGAPVIGSQEQQAEYIIGAVPSELTMNVASADKITFDMSFVGIDSEQNAATTDDPAGLGPKSQIGSAQAPSIEEADAFNTSSDFSRIKLSQVVPGDAFPSDTFAFSSELTLTLSNNVEPNKAIGVLGAFEVSAGTFEVGATLTAYFASVLAVQAVRNNEDITLDMQIVKQNQGMTVDLPLVTLGDGRPNVEQDQPITLPLTSDAATGAKIDSNLDYTLLLVFWDYLPDLADT